MSNTQRDDLARDLSAAYGSYDGIALPADTRAADGLIAAGYTRPRTITTVEELDALPVGSVVIDGNGDVCERHGSGWAGIIKEPNLDTWLLTAAEDLPLDCTVLHEGAGA